MATWFPEAIPLRKITASVIIKALVKFFTTLGLTKIAQTDQGTNFMSKIFTQVLQCLFITHRVSSAYHPESQGALERFHQTLKFMLRMYCKDTSKDWIRVSLWCCLRCEKSPRVAQLVFGHNVRGPLKLLRENILEVDASPKTNVLSYVSLFREHLHNAWALAKESLTAAQSHETSVWHKSSSFFSCWWPSVLVVANPRISFVCSLLWSICSTESWVKQTM